MLLCRHLPGDKDAEMTDAVMQAIDDCLAGLDDFVIVIVEIEYPVQCLLRRRDVVAPRAEHDNRRFDVAQVNARSIGAEQFARDELVADKQLVGDRLHLLGVEQYRAAPPFLEFEKARRLGIDLGIDVVDFLPISVVGVQRLEVRNQIGAVEDAVAEIARQRGQPGSAQEPAEIAHRVLAVHAGPIGERRSGEHDRADLFRMDRAHHHDLPAGLAVADQTGFAFGARVALNHRLDKNGLRFAHILDRLTGHRLGQKPNKVAGMAGRESDPDFAVVLHAADAGAMPCARIKDDERPFALVDRGAFGRDDPHKPIIHRARQRAAIEHQLDFEAQHMGRLAGIVLRTIVAALAQHIQK